MKLVCISDTHGDHRQVSLPEGDVLIHAGDVTAHGTQSDTQEFMQWLGSQSHACKLCIAGNHDTFMEDQPEATARFAREAGVVLLNDSGITVNGIKFWGSPITPRFLDWSFMRDAGEDIEKHWNQIPRDTEILITHGPPFGILDEIHREDGSREHTGCPSLLERIRDIRPRIHMFGHIHESHGAQTEFGVRFYNISTMNQGYQITNDALILEVLPAADG